MRSVRDYLRVSVIFLILCTLMSTAAFGGDLPAARTLKAAEKAGLTGVVRIGKKTYFLNARHQPDTAKGLHVVRQDQTYVLVQKDGQTARKGWNKKGRRTYYVIDQQGTLCGREVRKIGKKYYLFTRKGKLDQAKKDRIVQLEGIDYLVTESGRMGKGWQSIGKKNYYCRKDGSLVKDTVQDGIRINEKGIAPKRPKTWLEKKADAIVKKITTSKMSKKQKLRACWDYITSRSHFRYSSAYYPKAYTRSEFQRMARIMFKKKAGNCYCFASAFAALAKSIGYRAYVVYGRCPGTRDQAADGYTRHCWVCIAGKYYDPEAHFSSPSYVLYNSKVNPWREKGRCLI